MKTKNFYRSMIDRNTVFACLFLFVLSTHAATYYAIETGPGTWSNTASWSAISSTGVSCGCVPAATDNVIIESANVSGFTLTVDVAVSITNLTIGSNSANDQQNVILTVSSGNSLTVTGNLQINAGNKALAYTLDAGDGTINVNGTFSTWGTGGTNTIQLSTGTISFVPSVNLNNNAQKIIFNGAGTINFNADFTCNQSNTNFVTVSGCTVNFAGNYTQNSTNITMNSASTENFIGTGKTITPNKNILFGNLTIASDVNITLASAAGQTETQGGFTLNTGSTFTANAWTGCSGAFNCFYVLGDVTLNSSSTLNLNENMQCAANWWNYGGTLSGGSNTVTFESIGSAIGGTSSTTFPTLKIGNTANNVNITLSQNITCTNFTMDADNSSRAFTFDMSDPTMTVTGNATLNQPTGNNFTNSWNIDGGNATVSGNLIFAGTSNTTSRIAQVNIMGGSITLNGNVTWMANTAVATEVICISTGTITFANSFSMPQQSGTFTLTGDCTANFNGTTAPSFDLNQTNGGTPNAIFSNSFFTTINFNNGFRNANTATVFADGSATIFTGDGTITPSAAITFGNAQISSGKTVTLAGNVSVTDNWTNLGGTLIPGTNTVTFNGTATQTITKSGGETFYNLTFNTTGSLTLANDVTVTNALTMTAGNCNLNGNTLTLGNAAASALSRTAGILYGGTFKRWWLNGTAITGNSGNYYGLFPIGSGTDYRPVAINSTVNPTTAGYVLAQHVDALTVTDVTYTDNEGTAIVRKHDMKDVMSISGLAGGSYNIDASFTALSSTGTTTDMKLETYTGGAMGSVGTSAATTGTVPSPTVHRTALAATDLQNDWVLCTQNNNPVSGTPLRQYYYSRKNGNWSDVTAGNATWSYTSGGAGPSCDCKPSSDGNAVISAGNTISVDAASACDYLTIENTAALNGTANLTVNYDLTTNGNGSFTPSTGTWAIGRNIILNGTGNSSTISSAMTIAGDLTITTNAVLTLNAGLTVSGNLINNGTFNLGTNTLTLDGSEKNISGTGSMSGSSGTLAITNNKTILSTASLTIAPTFSLSGAATVTNNGTVTLQGSMTGTVAGSTWTNAAGSVLNIAGTNLLTIGTLNAFAYSNTVNYNGSGAQTITVPSAMTYYNLTVSNAGTKTAGGSFIVTVGGTLTIQDAAILSDNANSITGSTGNFTMNGTAQYLIANNTNSTPSLGGIYNITGGTIVFQRSGNQTVRGLNAAPAAYYNVNFANTSSGISTLSGPITVQNNLTVSNTSRLDASSSNYAISVAGNWTNSSTNGTAFNARKGTVTFNGTSAQTISNTGNASGTVFYNLTINNSNGISLAGSANATATNNLMLANGAVTTGSNILYLNNSSSGNLSYTNGFIYGNFKRDIASNTSTYDFPVGNGTASANRHLMSFVNNSLAGTAYLTASVTNFTQAAPNDDANLGTSQNSVAITSTAGESTGATVTWTLAPNASPTGGSYGVQLYVENTNLSSSDDNTFCPLKRNVTTSYADWDTYDASTTIPALGAAGRIYNSGSGYAQRTGYTVFSQFAIGKGTGPLPNELLSFYASLTDKNSVKITWVTASELNTDYFTVERSTGCINWEAAGKVKGAGNSQTLRYYEFVDDISHLALYASPFLYYRLKQTDIDGKFTFSQITAVRINPSIDAFVFPNPANGIFYVNIPDNEAQEVLIVVYDILGTEHYSKIVPLSLNDDNIIAIDPAKKLAPGVYMVTGSSSNSFLQCKVVIK